MYLGRMFLLLTFVVFLLSEELYGPLANLNHYELCYLRGLLFYFVMKVKG